MTFELKLLDHENNVDMVLWNPKESSLIWKNEGTPVLELDEKSNHLISQPFSPSDPLIGKDSNPTKLKIQLGLSCNYDCSYCNQSLQRNEASVSSMSDVDNFIATMDEWLKEPPMQIQFWGGEPFVYFAKLKKLVPFLRERFPNTQFGMVTNGSMIRAEQREFIEKYDISIAMSHDGQGQHLRGPDPLDDAEVLSSIQKLATERPDKFNFTGVITQNNSDVQAIKKYLNDKLGVPVRMDFEGVVNAHDSRVGIWSETEYDALRASTIKAFTDGNAMDYGIFQSKLSGFVTAITSQRESKTFGQSCGMDRKDMLAVDLNGSVMTCHSTGAGGEHNIGSVKELDKVKLSTSYHWSNRPDCSSCPVQTICGGSCMYLTGDDWKVSCENEYQFNMGILAGILFLITGRLLIEVNGDHTRPTVTRSEKLIPVMQIA